MSIARLQSLVWVLIYGGLFCVCVGFALQRGGQDLGWAVVAAGAGVAAVVRS